MSKIHVLDADTNKNYKIVIHTTTPIGNNTVGVSWQTAGINSGLLGSTVMTVGTGAGQILASEQSQVVSGAVIEIVITLPAESGGATPGSLDNLADQVISQKLNELSKKLKYFGYIQG